MSDSLVRRTRHALLSYAARPPADAPHAHRTHTAAALTVVPALAPGDRVLVTPPTSARARECLASMVKKGPKLARAVTEPAVKAIAKAFERGVACKVSLVVGGTAIRIPMRVFTLSSDTKRRGFSMGCPYGEHCGRMASWHGVKEKVGGLRPVMALSHALDCSAAPYEVSISALPPINHSQSPHSHTPSALRVPTVVAGRPAPRR